MTLTDTRAIRYVLLFLLVTAALSAVAAPSEEPSEDPDHYGPATDLLFWPWRQKLAGFRSIDKLYATRTIARGDHVYELKSEPRDFSALRYTVEGHEYSVDDFMNESNVVGLLLIKDGRILLERYAHGNNEHSRWISFSVAKSVVSMLLGAAVQDGYIASLDEKVTDYLPRLKGSSYDDVRIRDVIQMASGVAWDETYADPESDVNNMPQDILSLLRFVSGKKRVAKPGERFNYNTAETNVVGALVRAAIGNNLATYLSSKIWAPFGMEADANWLLHGEGGGERGGCCISATLRDYGRIGIFAMDDGVLPDGARVLPEGWIAASTTPSKGNSRYGYLWWLGPGDEYSALGIFGQMIHVDPIDRIVIVTHSAWDTAEGQQYSRHRREFIRAVNEFLTSR